jgi:hypothetical protein
MVERRKLAQKPLLRIKVRDVVDLKAETAAQPRQEGFTLKEATTILTAIVATPSHLISVEMRAATRGLPWLCCYSGARVTSSCLSTRATSRGIRRARFGAWSSSRRSKRPRSAGRYRSTATSSRRASWITSRSAERPASRCSTIPIGRAAASSTNRSVRSRTSRVSTKPFSETEYIRTATTPCPIQIVFNVAVAKPAAVAEHRRHRKHLVPPEQKRHHAKPGCGQRGNPPNRLMIGTEIKRHPGPERHRNPRQQLPGTGFGARPLAYLCDTGPPKTG